MMRPSDAFFKTNLYYCTVNEIEMMAIHFGSMLRAQRPLSLDKVLFWEVKWKDMSESTRCRGSNALYSLQIAVLKIEMWAM